MLLSVIELEWVVDRGALLHELHRPTGIRRNVTDGEQPMRQVGAAWTSLEVRIVDVAQQIFGIGNGYESG